MTKTRLLDGVLNVNNFSEVFGVTLQPGESGKIYFQFYDNTSKLRYIPASGCTVSVGFSHFNSLKAINNRPATQTFPDDRSIWSVDIMSTDEIMADSMFVSLTEGSITKKTAVIGIISITASNENRKFI
jgi:hypothetical protein